MPVDTLTPEQSATNPGVTTTRRRSAPRFSAGALLGAAPFFLFVAFFLIIPIVANTVVAFTNPAGEPTLENLAEGMDSTYAPAFLLSTQLSLLSAVVGAVLGLALAWALSVADKPRWLTGGVKSFTALASQSGGVTLAYGFIALLGTQGVLTKALDAFFPGSADGISITGFWGVTVVYLYFQVPLMAVLILPALQGLKQPWKAAATSLGATRLQYLKDVAIPVLWPAIAGSFLLLFANAFAAYATAYALSGGSLNLVPVLIGFLISGNVLLNPALAAALVTWMIVIIFAALGIRFYLTRRSDKWLQ